MSSQPRTEHAWLLIADSDDEAAMWAFLGLRSRGLAALEYVLPEEIALTATFSHQLSTAGDSSELALDNGRVFSDRKIRGVLNRWHRFPNAIARSMDSKDADYVAQEFQACFASWLFSLPCPVIPEPSPTSLCGQARSVSEWTWLAQRAGLRTRRFAASSDVVCGPDDAEWGTHVCFVVGAQVVPDSIPDRIRKGGVHLARLARTSLLGIYGTGDPDEEWVFSHATTMPDLREGGDELLDALLEYLR